MLPWIEKYRPQTLDDVIGNTEAVNKLKSLLSDRNIPNMILSGPPGSGKTSSIVCMANELLGTSVKDALLELNASDERGIDTVRKSIKMFCKKQVNLPPNTHKLVLLDEADNMTPSAQQALRRIIENYSNTTRFLFACNNSTRLIEAIQSRCIIMKFSRLSEEQIIGRLTDILTKENVKYNKKGLEAIIFISDGDMRQILNNTQAIATNYGDITEQNVYSICDIPHPDEMTKIINYCLIGDHISAHTAVNTVYNKGYSVVDILDTMFKVVKKSNETNAPLEREPLKNCKAIGFPVTSCKAIGLSITEREPLRLSMTVQTKMYYIKQISIIHMQITKGLDTLLQMNSLIARFCSQKHQHQTL